MKLIRFGPAGSEKPGILINNNYYDCSDSFEDWNRDFFLNNGISRLRSRIGGKMDMTQLDRDVRLGPPIARPGMIVCIGLNYSDHAKESGMEVPAEPVVFMKATNTIAGPNDTVTIPKMSKKTDWEVELGVVLEKDASYLQNVQEAENAIAGYCIVHDVSERSFQLERGGQWVKGKSCPGFTPAGPFLVTKDEITDVSNLDMKLSVNGNLMQSGSSRTMIFSPAYIVYYLSQFMCLEAGDLISTGTPPGVGLGMTPPLYLKDGDRVSLTISGLGRQDQEFRAFRKT